MLKKLCKWCLLALFALCVGIATLWYQLFTSLPDTFLVTEGHSLTFSALPYLSSRTPQGELAAAAAVSGDSYNTQLRLLGFLPVKQARVKVVSDQVLSVSGCPFGVKMFSDGVMVVGFSDIYTSGGYVNPAKQAGLALGDVLHTMNGIAVRTNEDVSRAVKESGGQPILIEYTHKNKRCTSRISPVLQQGGDQTAFRLGMWVRDSSAGIGTMTYLDTESGTFAGLGHCIIDADTGKQIQLLCGEIVPVNITGYRKSTAGNPGELSGEFIPETVGTITLNNEAGVFGKVHSFALQRFCTKQAEICPMQEITVGKAQILTTLDGQTPTLYNIEIEKLCYNSADPNKNMLLRVTDQRLLQETGGIVQGMSGSPIIQNGKLVGAVTHVIVNNPTKGYGIFIENMLEAAA